MGAADFSVTVKAKTAKEAFHIATEEAKYMHGHGGYTGTIAEKYEFKIVPTSKKQKRTILKEMDKLWDDSRSIVHDKWGPCACVKLPNDEWHFFGTASC